MACVGIVKKYEKMAKTISRKSSVKASAAKPPGKPLPGDKTLVIEPEIRFYELEYIDKIE